MPTDDHNMHSGSEGVADAWLHNWIPRVMASRGFRHHGAIFITWDEASKGDTPAAASRASTAATSRSSRSSTTAPATSRLTKLRSAYSLLRTIEAGFRFAHLGPRRPGPPAREVLLARGRQPSPFRDGSMRP